MYYYMRRVDGFGRVCVDPCQVECASVTDCLLAIDLVSRARVWGNTVNDLDIVAGQIGFGIVVVGRCFRLFGVMRVLRSVPTTFDWRVSRQL
jgi:hypothetical protein